MAQGVSKYTFLNFIQIVFHSYVRMVTIVSLLIILIILKTVIQD